MAVLSAGAQAQAPGPCATPDSVLITGNNRVKTPTVLADIGITKGDTLNFRVLQRAIRNLYATGQFDNVQLSCRIEADNRASVIFKLSERPLLGHFSVAGENVVSEGSLRDKIELLSGKPIDPAQVAKAVSRIDSLYEAKGYYLASVKPESTVSNGFTNITFRVDEGRRLAISGVDIVGDKQLSEGTIVGAMKTQPEGFWFWKKGEFDQTKFQSDITDQIPKTYTSNGFIDFQILHDTLIVDKQNGKALVQLSVKEGPQYHIGTFEVVGNRHFSTTDIDRFYPFHAHSPSLSEKVKGLFGGKDSTAQNLFDADAWDDATSKLRTAYANEGYIYATVRPVVERVMSKDSVPTVNLRWEIDEKTPATINRIEIAGNDYTSDACIRDALVILPGDVFSQDRLVRSYQNIQNLGFFESPLPPPDTKPANDKGDVDVIFHLKEKHTGSVNFGASVGEGTGLGGFIGLDQPNLFGLCKRASVQWQYGQYINDLQLSYTDPAIRQSRTSGTVTAYSTYSRYLIADLGQSKSSGGSVQLGFPVFGSYYTRLFVSYGAEGVRFTGGLATRDTTINTNQNIRSAVTVTLTHDNRIDMPFPSAGSMRTITAEFNGGPLGGSASFQRYTTELRNYATITQWGGDKPGSQPMKLVFGLTARAGMLFGDAGPFFYSQKFAMGGTQYGEQLRGYEEFSITPAGFVPGTNSNATVQSFGNAFFSTTAELGVRFNSMVYSDLFYDAGNVYDSPRDFDPTRLFRGAGIGVAIVTPLGPLGLDWGYGFDRVDQFGRPDPKWQLHFKLGQIF